MNAVQIFAISLQLAIQAILTIEKVVGDQKSGADKKTMAQDALSGATAGALSVLTGGNAQLAQVASSTASGLINTAVALAKITGDYQKATTEATSPVTAPVSPAPTTI